MASTQNNLEAFTPDSASNNRQSRKLQLRKAGFKAKDLPTTRLSSKSSGSWSHSNVSGSLAHKGSESDLRSPSTESQPTNSILKQISNSSRRRKKHGRPRIDESIFIYQDENATAPLKPCQLEPNRVPDASARCATPGTQRPRSASKVTPASRKRGQSVSIDTAKYIEHLESELAAVQTQLAAMTSPTVLQARSMKMRTLNAETRALHDEVTEWEKKFHERVQEEIEERSKIEAGLKARVRLLEGDTEDYAQKIKDLQGQVERSATFVAAAETANVELERRIDAISGLVASPRRSELDRPQSFARDRHSRHKSLLPRFPTTGSLNLPFKTGDFAPPSPKPRPSSIERSSNSQGLRIEVNKDALAVLTGSSSARLSPLSDDPSSCGSKRFSWATNECYTSLETVAASGGRPSRRMRRFHAGTVMPKPLLLPSTASYAYAQPATAPVQDKEQTPPQFPFPELPDMSELPTIRNWNFDCLLSPMPGNGRRRALTCIEDVAAAMRRTSNPFLAATPFPAAMAKSSSRSASTNMAASDRTPDVSSVEGQMIGRNLFDELKRVADESDPTDPPDSLVLSRTTSAYSTDTPRASQAGSMRSNTSHVGLRKRAWTSHQRMTGDQQGHGSVMVDRTSAADDVDDDEDEDDDADDVNEDTAFCALVAAVFRQTYDTARQALMYAQNVTLRSATVQKLQWWLVQVLLGPMMSRRMMTKSMRRDCRKDKTQRDQAASGSGATRKWRREVGPTTSREVAEMGQSSMALDHRNRDMQVRWISKHNPWLWVRFSLALIFAIGAALRDGPAVVLGISEEEEEEDEEDRVD